ncbi:MAG: T9SS type A sorting domain-containing protein [Bacteroidetes bacterium]|nr:T9SS type A sorting domain-containing protein [Bacteroidota bacterium]
MTQFLLRNYHFAQVSETGNQWVTSNSFSYCTGGLWQQGTPAKPNLNGAHTGNTAWTTNLTSNYANKDSSGLFSSLFRVQAGHCYLISFWQQFRMEYGSDGGALDYSTDYGVTWNRLDMTGTPNITLFGASPNYTYVSELDPSDPTLKGFTGYRNTWFKSEKAFRPDVDAQVVIRWRFASDYSATDEGWSIDDVCFEDLGLCSPVGIDEFAINDFGMSQNYPNPAVQNTTFEYMIPTQGQVRIVLHDMIGQEVSVIADQNMAAGKHTVQLNTAGYAPGLYTYTLVYEGQQITKRMIITQ